MPRQTGLAELSLKHQPIVFQKMLFIPMAPLLPAAEANVLVGRLESEKGLALRSLGKSLLPGMAMPAPSPPSAVARSRPGLENAAPADRGAGPQRTLVLVVLER